MTKTRLHTIRAEGDGNCAFNSYSLSLCEPSVLDQIAARVIARGEKPDDVFKKFITDVATAFKLRGDANWESVKAKLLIERRQNPTQLQRKLAPILRELAVDLAEQDEENYKRTLQPIQSAFNNYLGGKLHLPWAKTSDDIFAMHSFITKKFAELYGSYHPNTRWVEAIHNRINKKSSEQVASELAAKESMMLDALKEWWRMEGYAHFLQEMRKSGKWAGDLELFQLSRYFNVNLDVYRGEALFSHIRIHYGEIPAVELHALNLGEDEELTHQMGAPVLRNAEWLGKQLHTRGLGERTDTNDFLLYSSPTPDFFTLRLDAVPGSERVLEIIADYERKNPDAKLTSQVFAVDETNANSIPELLARDVITHSDHGYKFTDITCATARERVCAIPEKDQLLIAFTTHYEEPPTLSLINNNAIHWNAGRIGPAAEMSVEKNKNGYKEMLAELRKQPIKYNETEHKELVTRAERISSRVKEKDAITYTLGDKEINVSKRTQMKLDEELAKKLQHEEQLQYRESLRKK